MKHREWKSWVRSKPWALRWFIYLVLLRPVIDNLYYLKHVSPFLSPLYIVGVLSPLLALGALLRFRMRFNTPADRVFRLWSIMLLIISIAMLILWGPNLVTLSNVLKFIMPAYLYFFLRILVQGRRDLEGLIRTFMYSLVIVLAIFFYELFLGPIRITESRGLTRYQGNFGDVFNYGLYISFGLIFLAYHQLKAGRYRFDLRGLLRLALILGIGILVLLRINHAATLIVFSSITLIFIYYLTRRNALPIVLMVLMGVLMFQYKGDQLFEENVNPLFEKEFQVLSGDVNEEQLFHGRYGRWQYYLDYYNSRDIISRTLSVPLFNPHDPVFLTTGGGSHNDYIRIGMYSGLLGLFLYLLFHWRVFRLRTRLPAEDRFLVGSALLMVLLYSITLTPT
ncbi:MAG: hypothetical protein IH599_03025, partial [Bacteroidales bacterium]|nr:hypothetical protein [Bacteroidales bacterium]